MLRKQALCSHEVPDFDQKNRIWNETERHKSVKELKEQNPGLK